MRSFLPIMLAGLFCASGAVAQSLTLPPRQTSTEQAMAAPTTGNMQDSEFHVLSQGNIRFISGGVGEEGRTAMLQAAAGYNVRLLFARQGSGEYLADVGVILFDTQGKLVLDAKSDGPLFYAAVPPGRYTLKVATEGQTQTRMLDISGVSDVSQSFYWPPQG